MNVKISCTLAVLLFLSVFSHITSAPAEPDDDNVGPALEIEAETNEVITEQTTERNSSSIFNEEGCLRSGGTCLPEIECPHGSLSAQRGLCPMQQDMGVECCHGLSVLETRCQARGGHCQEMTTCSKMLIEDRAEDCEEDKVCCVLVRS